MLTQMGEQKKSMAALYARKSLSPFQCPTDGAAPYSHIDTPVPVRSLKLSNVGSD